MQTQTMALYRPVSVCFRLSFSLPQNQRRNLLLHTRFCCPLSVPSSLPSTHQYLRLEHSASTTRKTRTAGNRGILVLAIIRLGCEGFSSGVARANEKVVNAAITENATQVKLKIFFEMQPRIRLEQLLTEIHGMPTNIQ